MQFTKMQGAGNDFIVINNLEEKLPQEKLSALAARLCSRRLSIGADGFMVADAPTEGGDFRMLFYNSDGSVGEMCGNGARCIARYGHMKGLGSGDELRIETDAGIVVGKRVSDRMYTVKMNDPFDIELQKHVAVPMGEYDCSYMVLGVPHAVFIMDDYESRNREELRKLGSQLRFCSAFPKGANVNFCRIAGPDHIVAETFERGVEDFTLACGTGCCSIVTALTLRGLVSGQNVRVTMPGGDLFVTLDAEDVPHDVYLTGPTNVVAEGEVMDEDII